MQMDERFVLGLFFVSVISNIVGYHFLGKLYGRLFGAIEEANTIR